MISKSITQIESINTNKDSKNIMNSSLKRKKRSSKNMDSPKNIEPE